MELEKCSCCLRYKPESELKVSHIISEDKKYFHCDKCAMNVTIPLNIVNDNIDKLDINHYNVYYRDEYMTIKEYLQKK